MSAKSLARVIADMNNAQLRSHASWSRDSAAALVEELIAARREIRRKDRALRAIRHELLHNRGTDQDPLSKIIDAALAARGKAKR